MSEPQISSEAYLDQGVTKTWGMDLYVDPEKTRHLTHGFIRTVSGRNYLVCSFAELQLIALDGNGGMYVGPTYDRYDLRSIVTAQNALIEIIMAVEAGYLQPK